MGWCVLFVSLSLIVSFGIFLVRCVRPCVFCCVHCGCGCSVGVFLSVAILWEQCLWLKSVVEKGLLRRLSGSAGHSISWFSPSECFMHAKDC